MSFPLMPLTFGASVPFSARLAWEGARSDGETLDVSDLVTQPRATLLVVQTYSSGGETYYIPPYPLLNGVEMGNIARLYSNALDDGRSFTASANAVSAGGPYTLTWQGSGARGLIYEVTGFYNLISSIYAQASSTVQTSSNTPCASSTSVDVATKSVVFYVAAGSVTADAALEQASVANSDGFVCGWDEDPVPTSQVYTGGNRLRYVVNLTL